MAAISRLLHYVFKERGVERTFVWDLVCSSLPTTSKYQKLQSSFTTQRSYFSRTRPRTEASCPHANRCYYPTNRFVSSRSKHSSTTPTTKNHLVPTSEDETTTTEPGITLEAFKHDLHNIPTKGTSTLAAKTVWRHYITHIRQNSEDLKKLDRNDWFLLLSQLGRVKSEHGASFSQKAEIVLGDMESAGSFPDASMFEEWAEHADISSFADAESFLSTVWWCGAPDLVSDRLFAILIRVIGKKDLVGAGKLLKKAVDSGRAGGETYMEIVLTLCRNGREDVGIKTCEDMGVDVTDELCAKMLYACGKADRGTDALWNVFDWAKKDGKAHIETYTELIRQLCKRRDIQRAVELCKEFAVEKSIPPTTKMCNTLLWAFAREGEDKQAQEILMLMKADGIPLDAISYTALIYALVKQEDIDGAHQVFQMMEDSSLNAKPVVQTYNAMFEMMFMTGRVEDAMGILQDMQMEGIEPSVYTYGVLIKGLTKNGRAEDALSVFGAMMGKGVDPAEATWIAVMQAYVALGRVDDGTRFLYRMREEGWMIGLKAVTVLLHGHLQGNNFEAAYELFNYLLQQKIPPDLIVYSCFVDAYGRLDDLDNVDKVLRQMTGEGVTVDAVVYNMLMFAHARRGRITDAERVLEDMKGVGIVPTVRSYTILIDAVARDGDIIECERLVQEMESIGVWPNVVTYTCLISGMLKKGDGDGAVFWFERMVKGWNTISKELRIKVDAKATGTTLYGLARLNDFTNTLKIAFLLDEYGIPLLGHDYVYLIEAYGKMGRPIDAEKLYRRMVNEVKRVGRKAVNRGRDAVVEAYVVKGGDGAVREFLRRARMGWKGVKWEEVVDVEDEKDRKI